MAPLRLGSLRNLGDGLLEQAVPELALSPTLLHHLLDPPE
jgi:hypothetical protein